MFNSVFLDVVIGLIFIFLLYSLLATAVQELVSTWLNMRGKNLLKSIMFILGDSRAGEKLGVEFYRHPVVKKLIGTDKGRLPSYFDPATFSQVVQDILPNVQLGNGKALTIEERIRLLPDGDLKESIQSMINYHNNNVDRGLQNWFNNSMERLSGVYKRKTQANLLVIGLLIAVFLNVNSLYVFDRLTQDKAVRERLISQAERFLEQNPQVPVVTPGAPTTNQDTLYQRFIRQREEVKRLLDNEIGLANNTVGIGWGVANSGEIRTAFREFDVLNILKVILGWIVTAIAISIGAPFWFDLLQKLVRVRSSGPKPKTKNED